MHDISACPEKFLHELSNAGHACFAESQKSKNFDTNIKNGFHFVFRSSHCLGRRHHFWRRSSVLRLQQHAHGKSRGRQVGQESCRKSHHCVPGSGLLDLLPKLQQVSLTSLFTSCIAKGSVTGTC